MKGRVGVPFLAVIIALSGVMLLAGGAFAASNHEPSSPDCHNKIVIKKVTEPSGGSNFDFTLKWGTNTKTYTLNDGDTITETTNSYSIFTLTEAVKADYYLKSIACSGLAAYKITYDLPNRRVIINLNVDKTVTCTFTNARYGKITVNKFEDPNNNGQWDNGELPLKDWEFDLSGTKTANGKTDSNGKLVFENLVAGAYIVTEKLKDEYVSTTGLVQNVTLNPNGDVTLYFGNRRLSMDYGDLPLAYGLTLFSEGGARHLPLEQGDVWLGMNRDAEYDGYPNDSAMGDDNDNDDEDGVERGATWGGGSGRIYVTVNGPSCLMGWVDYATVTETLPTNLFKEFGFDGKFTESFDKGGSTYSEKVIDNRLLTTAGVHEITFPLPADFGGAGVFARFRLSPAIRVDGRESSNPAAEANGEYDCPSVGLSGFVTGGEVEDYAWTFGPNAIELKRINVSQQRSSVSIGWVSIGVLISTSALWVIKRRRK